MMDQYVGHKGAFQSTKTFQIGIVSFGPVIHNRFATNYFTRFLSTICSTIVLH